MSTHSTITAKLSNGNFGTIYCQFDGYPSYNGKILYENYTNQVAINLLIAQGDLSSLDKSPEKPEGHTYDTPVKGFCVYYGRDRGEDDTETSYGDTAEDALAKHRCGAQGYNYLWDGRNWYVDGELLTPEIVGKV